MLGNFSSNTGAVVKVRLLEEAQRHFEAEDAWWRANRDAKDLFTDEFAAALVRLSTLPEVGQHYRLHRGRLIQRILMGTTRCHVYYFVDHSESVVEIHSIWGAHRGQGPKL
jgi:hypothetical protein